MKLLTLLPLAVLSLSAQSNPLDYLNHNHPVLDAHNCYPYEGRWADRIDRALSTGIPVAIEQDLAWYVDPVTGKGSVVVSHEAKTTGAEPTLKRYFFDRVQPIVEQALKDPHPERWPLITLHFDFKSNEAPLLHAVWNLLGEYQDWITTARKTSSPRELAPFDPKPLLVLTEDSDLQEQVFFDPVAVGSKLRVFGSAHTVLKPAMSREQEIHYLATAAPEQLLPAPPTNYRRWWNNSWFEVEEGGQHHAGDWTRADERRLRSLVDHAHQLGYWIRFYTLDGFAPAGQQGWGESYNFGSRDAVLLRWRAAMDAGVNLIATDQYESLGALIAH